MCGAIERLPHNHMSMSSLDKFVEFPKIPRLLRPCVVTEKIDGTNASVHIGENGEFRVASRTRWIEPGNDNRGFAMWAHAHKDQLINGLGPGSHFGEWWGQGIGRGYGLKEKRFSLFNTGRWNRSNIPDCCDVVPVLYEGPFDTGAIELVMGELLARGSAAAPGFSNPEGVVVYHVAAQQYFKVTFEHDQLGKGGQIVTPQQPLLRPQELVQMLATPSETHYDTPDQSS